MATARKTMRQARALLGALAAGFVVAAQPAAANPLGTELRGPATTISGDTLRIRGVRVRLYASHAPKLRESCWRDGRAWACGRAARERMAAWIGNGEVRCEPLDLRHRFFVTAICRADGRDLGATMVVSGWATATWDRNGIYRGLMGSARAEGRGLWARHNTPPSGWQRWPPAIPPRAVFGR